LAAALSRGGCETRQVAERVALAKTGAPGGCFTPTGRTEMRSDTFRFQVGSVVVCQVNKLFRIFHNVLDLLQGGSPPTP
jgi:hypothetical protein